MDRTRRNTKTVNRLTYSAPGQPSELTGPLGINTLEQQKASSSSSDRSLDTLEGLDYWIDFNERLVKMAEQDLQTTADEATRCEGRDQDTMAPEEWDAWQTTRTNRNNAAVALKQATERLQDFYKRRDQLVNQQQHHGNETVSKFSVPLNPLTSINRSSASVTSTASTLKRRTDIEAKRKVMQLRHQLSKDEAEIDNRISAIREQQPKEEQEEQVQKLENRRKLLQKSFYRREQEIQEECDLAKEEIELDFEELNLGTDLPPAPSIIDGEWTGFQSTSASNRKGEDGEVQDKGNLDLMPQDWFKFGFQRPVKSVPINERKEPSLPQQNLNHWNHQQTNTGWQETRPPVEPEQLPADTGDAVLLLANTLTTALKGVHVGKEWEPKDLPIFSGKAEDWPIFYNEFRRTTPDGKVNTSQNLIRLRKAIKGSARDAITGLLHEPQNVVKILRILQERFGRPELIIRAMIEKAEQCRSPDANKPETFVNFGTAVQHLVETVRSMNEERYLNDMTLLDKLVGKMPALHAREWLVWLQSNPQKVENLQSFGEWIDAAITLNVRLTTPVVKEETATPKGRTTRGPVKLHAVTTEPQRAEQAKDCCSFCGMKNHRIGKCFKFRDKSLDERVKHVKENGLCFRCLGVGHTKRDCQSSITCDQEQCKLLHHPLLHGEGKPWRNKKAKVFSFSRTEDLSAEIEGKDSGKDMPVSKVGAMSFRQSKPISIVQIRVKGPRGIRRVYALLDSGCDTSIILSSLADSLGIEGKRTQNQCHVVGGKSFKVVCKEVNFEVAGAYKTAKFYPINAALTMENLGLSTYTQDAAEVKQRWSHLQRAKLLSFIGVSVQVIIGEDHPYITAHRELLQRQPHEPMAKRTLLGWVLAGKVNSSKGNININAITIDGEDNSLDDLIKANFSLDSYGVYPKDTLRSLEDRRALEMLNSTVRKVGDNKWECGLLWKDKHAKLPPSKEEAVSRLLRNEKRMKRDPIYSEMYHAKINEYLEKGYARELTPAEVKVKSEKTFYIPHFGVYNVNKPGKLRLVFDAACRGGTGLNKYLLTGPDLIRPLSSVLLNFRIHNFVITGDMEDMYHRVGVRQEDRDSQRFLWRDMEDKNKQIRELVMEVLLFGSCCSQSSAIYVKDRNAEQFLEVYPEAVRAVKQDFYSDDCLSGAQTREDAINLRKQITEINAAGNFAVKKWHSNCKEIIATIPESDRASGLKSFTDKTELPAERVLGLWWKPEEDAFTFSANYKKIDPALLEGRRPTKREMCRVLMSVFDPLGFISNYRIKGLILLQRTWQAGVNWDDDITDTIYQDWRVWVEDLKKTENILLPRCYIKDIHLATSVQLHTMVDASEEATSAVCYLRIKFGEFVSVAFVNAKAKVAPLKKQTIPRLELIAAVMGACLADSVVNDLRVKIQGRYFWSDSRTVLKWIRTESLRYKEYVANRVNRIHLLSNVREWRWVPTSLNVADQGTRLHNKIDLSSESLWLKGPAFLLEEPEFWPKEDGAGDVAEEILEIRKPTLFAVQVLEDPLRAGIFLVGAGGSSQHGATVNMSRFSSYERMIRAQCGVIAAAKFWRNKLRGTPTERPWSKQVKKLSSYYSPEIRLQAKLMLIRKTQSEAFGEDLTNMMEKGCLTKSSKLWRFSPFLENGILKINGRMGNADIPAEMKQPILLPARHQFTTLLVMKEHQRNAHQGQATVLAEVRKQFWILEGRNAVRRIVESCQPCRLRKAVPVVPKMGELPYYRVAAGNPPFTYTGVDLMGPVEVTVGRHHEKRWIVVFTCMVTRAVHLDVVYGLSTDETMMALSRFIDQRGRPRHIYSDNGTNFVGAKGELQRSWSSINWEAVMNTERFAEIKWQFSPPCSPHFGGAWERMVQEVKKILKNTLLEKFPKDQTLLTMLKGAENIINSRPLPPVSSDPTDEEVLTPNHLVRGFADVGPSVPGEYEDADECRRAHWRRTQVFVNQFWKRWTREVLPELIRRDKWCRNTEPITEGELVLLVDDQAPRNTWRKGVVVELFPGKDEQVRVVRVETVDWKTKKRTSFKRGVDKVVRLGLRMENRGDNPDFGGRNVKSTKGK